MNPLGNKKRLKLKQNIFDIGHKPAFRSQNKDSRNRPPPLVTKY